MNGWWIRTLVCYIFSFLLLRLLLPPHLVVLLLVFISVLGSISFNLDAAITCRTIYRSYPNFFVSDPKSIFFSSYSSINKVKNKPSCTNIWFWGKKSKQFNFPFGNLLITFFLFFIIKRRNFVRSKLNSRKNDKILINTNSIWYWTNIVLKAGSPGGFYFFSA